MRTGSRLLVAFLPLALAACATTGTSSTASRKVATPRPAHKVVAEPVPAHAPKPKASPYAAATEDLSKRGNYVAGGLYLPGVADTVPDEIPDVDAIPEPEVREEPRARTGNRDYSVLGKRYSVIDEHDGYVEVGLASYYGNKFHGRRTSSQEVYDMYAFTAAHKTLPLPSFARVTNLTNGKSVIVRINDRGPFHPGRIIDLSYAAAVKLGVDRAGTARVEVKGLGVGDDAREAADTRWAAAASPSRVTTPATPRAASAIDHLLDALPIASANAGERPQPAAVVVANPAPVAAQPATVSVGAARFDMLQDGRTMTADQFDGWMRARRMRVATGRPGQPDPAVGMAAATPTLQPPAPRPVSLAVSPAQGLSAAPAAASSTAGAEGAVTYQVASFAARANAERALSMLSRAGIADARLLDADANGKPVWRLRVGPVQPDTARELIARIQGLGFGQPQRVHE